MLKNVRKLMTIPFVLVLLMGCASGGGKSLSGEQISTAQIAQEFQSGSLRLTCGLSCAGTWGHHRNEMMDIRFQDEWEQLYLRVAEIGHDVDLAYFYLGLAAEELGHLEAASIYYYIAGNVDNKCDGVFNNCDGVIIEREISDGLARLGTDEIAVEFKLSTKNVD